MLLMVMARMTVAQSTNAHTADSNFSTVACPESAVTPVTDTLQTP
jgi:hypothetical protein